MVRQVVVRGLSLWIDIPVLSPIPSMYCTLALTWGQVFVKVFVSELSFRSFSYTQS